MSKTTITSKAEWLKARLALLEKEKSLTKLRDELARQRQQLPWVKLEKSYTFESDQRPVTLDELFQDKSQLIVYHFMFDPNWDEGCKSCSLISDHLNPSVVHLAHRDTALVVISKAPIEKLTAFKKRMDWRFPWVSSGNNDFNRDFHVSFTQEEIDGNAYYNFQESAVFPVKEAPGLSVFAKDDNNNIYHTYSNYGRGLEDFMGIYRLLDVVPKGRNEDTLTYGMEWVRHKDRYSDSNYVDPYSELV